MMDRDYLMNSLLRPLIRIVVIITFNVEETDRGDNHEDSQARFFSALRKLEPSFCEQQRKKSYFLHLKCETVTINKNLCHSLGHLVFFL
jgi:hypothetical protein